MLNSAGHVTCMHVCKILQLDVHARVFKHLCLCLLIALDVWIEQTS